MRKQRKQLIAVAVIAALVSVLVACGSSITPEAAEVNTKKSIEATEVENNVAVEAETEVEEISTPVDIEEPATTEEPVEAKEQEEPAMKPVASNISKPSAKAAKATPVVADEDLLISSNLAVLPVVSENTVAIQADPNVGASSGSNSSSHHHHDDADDEKEHQPKITVYDWLGGVHEATLDNLEAVLLGIYTKAEHYRFEIEEGKLPLRGYKIEYSPIGTIGVDIAIAVVQVEDSGVDISNEVSDIILKVYQEKKHAEVIRYDFPMGDSSDGKGVIGKPAVKDIDEKADENTDEEPVLEEIHTWSGCDHV